MALMFGSDDALRYELPPGWSAHVGNDCVKYYYNCDTGTSQWEKPSWPGGRPRSMEQITEAHSVRLRALQEVHAQGTIPQQPGRPAARAKAAPHCAVPKAPPPCI